jgi:hypothetical protein
MPNTTPSSDAASGATLNGTNWLTDILKTGLTGYVAVETLRAQRRDQGATTTQDVPRVGAPAASTDTLSPKAIAIGVGLFALAILAAIFIGRRK